MDELVVDAVDEDELLVLEVLLLLVLLELVVVDLVVVPRLRLSAKIFLFGIPLLGQTPLRIGCVDLDFWLFRLDQKESP